MPEPPAPRPLRERLPRSAQVLVWPLTALGLLLLFHAQWPPGFLRIESVDGRLSGYLIDILRDGSTVMLVALGMTLVIATGGVDLSVGAVMALAAVVSASMVTPGWLGAVLGPWALQALEQQPGLWVVLVVAVSLAAATLAGAWNGVLVAGLGMQPIVATLILMVAGRGLAQLVCSGQIYTYDQPQLAYLGQGVLAGLPVGLWLAAGVLVLTQALTRLTALGMMIESVGDNDTASYYTGLRSGRIKFLAYVFCGLCAGVAGLVESANVSSANANQIGLWFELDAIFAVVVGGTALTGGRFLIVGTVVGALLIQTLTSTMVAQQVSPEVALIPKAVVIVAVCLLQSPAFRRSLPTRRRPGGTVNNRP